MAPRRQDAGSNARTGSSHRRLRYGGPWFSAASALPLDGGLVRYGRLPALLAAAVRHPLGIAALMVLLVRTRSEQLHLSESPAGETLRSYFNERSLGVFPRNRLCQGVLLVPQVHSAYLRGHRRQALRTNLRRAASAGIRCEIVRDRRYVVDEILEIRRQQTSFHDDDTEGWRTGLVSPQVTLMVARDKRGTPVAWTGVVLDESVCLITLAGATSHEARWALHDYLVRVLIARRTRYLLASGGGPFGALGYAASVQHYQHLLGYELRHLVPVSVRELRRKRRRGGFSRGAVVTVPSLDAPDDAAGWTPRVPAGAPTSAGPL